MPDGGGFRAGLTTAMFGAALLGAWWLGLFGPIIAELGRALVSPASAGALEAARAGAGPASVSTAPVAGSLAPLSA